MKVIANIMLAALISAPVAAIADSPAITRLGVQTKDINLSTPTGVTALNRRVRAAIREACTSVIQSGTTTAGNESACRQAATRDAQAQLAKIVQSHQSTQVAAR